MLAAASGIGLSTINRYENETRPPRHSAIKTIQATFESAGIVFIFASRSGGPGVRLRSS